MRQLIFHRPGLLGLLVLLTSAAHPLAAQPVSFEDHQLVRVYVQTEAQLNAIEAVGGVIMNCVPGVGPMDVVVDPAQRTALENLGLRIDLLHDNVQQLIDRERGPGLRADPFTDFFLDYHPYDNGLGSIVWYLGELAGRYPALASVVSIGTTLQGRTIWGLRLANDAVAGNKPAVVYFGAEHAREWITTTAPPYFATHLLANYGSDPVATDLVDHVEFFLIPVFNVDGYEYTWTNYRFWRKNRRLNGDGSYGVDLNRNWGQGWGGAGSSASTFNETYRGTAPFSEPETQVLRDFFLAHPNVRAQLDIHSYSQLILWPYGYTSALSPDQSYYQNVGSAMQSLIFNEHGRLYSAGPIYTAIYPAAGNSVDWTYAQRDILSFSFELRPASASGLDGFALPADQIIPNNQELLPAMLHLTNSEWVRLPLRIDLPAGAPDTLIAGQDAVITVNVVDQLESLAPGSARMYYRYDANGPYLEQPLTALGGGAFQAVLPATNCSLTPEYYFAALGDAGSEVTKPAGGPAEAFTAIVVEPAFHAEPLATDPGWSADGLWAWGIPLGQGTANQDPTVGFTGSRVYGYNLAGNYENNLSPQYLTSNAIDCTGRSAIHLRFRRWLGVQGTGGVDNATVEVSNDGTNWTLIWQAVGSGGVNDAEWTLVDYDISALADNQPAVYVRWGMGPTDGALTGPGWNIDDIELAAASCTSAKGDYNGDHVIDLLDFAALPECVQGPGGGLAPTCGIFDFDNNGAIDLLDFAAMQQAFAG